MIDQKIFRAYDIRGTYPEQLNSITAELIGKGFGTYLIKKLNLATPNVVVGRDCRTHSPEIQTAFISGLVSTGCNVTNIGTVPSPMLYFANTVEEFDGGCNITASHNPKEYNGFKLIANKAHAVFGEEIQKIYQIINEKTFIEGNGNSREADFYDTYSKKIADIFTYPRKLKVVVDTANGVAGSFYPKILKELGHKVVELYSEPDGNFPNHEPDPIVEENLTALKNTVIKEKADIGLAFDGDGDRVGIVDGKGKFINSDKLLMLLSKDVLSRYPGRTIVFTVSNSQSLFDLIKQWGGTPFMCKVGHSYVEDAMNKKEAVLGGEQSGHFFLPEDYYPYDDALITACRILFILSNSDKKLSKFFEDFPETYSYPEMRPYCSDDKKFDVLERVIAHFKDNYPSNTLDGVRLDFGKGGWAGIRVSNTSPRVSIIMEAQTENHLKEIENIVLGHLKSYPEIDWNR